MGKKGSQLHFLCSLPSGDIDVGSMTDIREAAAQSLAVMWDILYAVDASTSMGEPSSVGGGELKVEAVKKGIQHVVSGPAFPHGSRVGVMAFRAPTKAMGMIVDSKQEMTQRVLPLTLISELHDNPVILRDALDTMKVGGATPTGEGLKAAVETVHDVPDDGHKRIKKVILVTDEKSNFGPKPESILDGKLVRRAIVDVVAIEKAGDRKAFEMLTSRSGGRLTVVNDAATLALALDPKIPYTQGRQGIPLIDEAERVLNTLKVTDREGPSYRGLVMAVAAVRTKTGQRLQETVALVGEARADLDLAVAAAVNDPKWPTMSMKEFADRVWSKGADLAKLQDLEDAYRKAIGLLSA
jgi:Mg-chelatase subunit ChlD